MSTINQNELKNDLYEAVNGEWLKTAKIPDDKPATGGFNDLVDDIDKKLMGDLDELVKVPSDDSRLNEATKLYQLAKDFDRRDREGITPLQDRLAKLKALNSYDDYQKDWATLILEGSASPVSFDIDADMKNATVYALFAAAPGLILPEKTYYDKDNPQGPHLLKMWSIMTKKLLQKVGYDETEADDLIDDTIQFDSLLVPHVKSAEESADYSKMYNPQSFTEFTSHTAVLDLGKVIQQSIGSEPDKIIVTEPKYFDALDGILKDHFEIFKSWLLVNEVLGQAGLLTDDLRTISGEYSRALSGSKKPVNHRKFAFYLTRGIFSQVIGDYYGRKYFGETAKADVTHMVKQMVEVYKNRLHNNEWLGDATKQKAITKLNHLGIQVGYPDSIPDIYNHLKVDLDKSLLENVNDLGVTANKELFSRWNKPVDRMRWEMSAATVNAYYHPFKNIIVFPAAILQAPFYGLEQTSSENYGGIGAVIAHEISHAFDNNGALFDEYGNLHNWWTKEDNDHFQQLAQKMINEFNDLPFAGQKVNGKLTVSENIADGGGLSCALAAAQEERDYSGREFFVNWARIWRMKATTQYMQLLLSIDVHAPNKLRANVQAQNQDEFFKTFDIHEGDGMWKSPDERVNIW